MYDYIGVDRVLERLYPQNGTRETFLDNTGTVDIGYDGVQRPIEDRTLRSDNSLVVGFTYTYDRMGNALTEGKLHDPANSETYTYDSAYRLLTFNRAPGGITPSQTTWKLDGVGNWDQVSSETRQYSSTNELVSRTSPTVNTAITYDEDGNETNDGTYAYTYDAENRLTSVTRDSDSALIAVYSYDALGRRIQKVVTNDGALNGTTDYAYDGWQDIEEHNGAGTLTQQYVYGIGIDEPLVMDRNLNGDATATGPGDQRLFYSQNALGSVYALTDVSGTVVEGYQYDAYGLQTVFDPGTGPVFSPGQTVTVGGASQVGNPYLFTGQRLDPETGLYYYRARFYDPTQGRFLSRDSAGSAGGANLYQYADDSPETRDDAFGMLTMDECKKKVREFLDGKVVYEEKTNGDTHFFTIKGWKTGAVAKTDEEKLLKYLLENHQDASKYSPLCLIGMICQKCTSTTTGARTSSGGWITFNAAQTGGWGGKLDTLKHELIHAYDFCKQNFRREGDCKKSLLTEIRAYRYADQCKDAATCFTRAKASSTSVGACTEQDIARFGNAKEALYQEALKVPVLNFPAPK